MSKTALLLTLILIAGCTSYGEEKKKRKIEWIEDYNQGMQLAQESTKPVMLFFTASWCPPCRELMQTVFSSDEVLRISKHFLNIYVDVDKDRKTMENYKVRKIPTIIFLDHNGATIEEFNGKETVKNILTHMKAIAKKYA